MLPLWIALQFLSSLPIRLPGMPEPQQLGRSLLFYPLVGLLFGVILWVFNLVLAGAPLLLHAALLLTVWVPARRIQNTSHSKRKTWYHRSAIASSLPPTTAAASPVSPSSPSPAG